MTNQVLQVSFKIVAGDLNSRHSFGSYMNQFESHLFYAIILFVSCFNIQYITVFLVTCFINFGVTNQAPQVSFNFVVEDLMLVLPYEFYDIIFFEILVIYEDI